MTDDELVHETITSAFVYLTTEGASQVAEDVGDGVCPDTESLVAAYGAGRYARDMREALISTLGFLRAVAKAAEGMRRPCDGDCLDEHGFPKAAPFQRCAACDLNHALLHLRASDIQRDRDL
jgi:hypothetical protein